MKKLFKAAASLTVGCALLSTSAFAALDGSVVKNETGATATVTINGYAAKAQSTILVVKGETELEAIPADLADGAIAYINQAEATEGTINYDVNVTGDGTYTVFAGGSDQSAASKIGAFTIAPEKPAGAEAIAITLNGQEVTEAAVNILSTIQFDAAITGTAASDVVWTVDDGGAGTIENGLYTPAAFSDDPYDGTGIGEFTVTATVDGKSDSVKLRVWRYGDVNGDGSVTYEDALEVLYFEIYDYENSGILGSYANDPYDPDKSIWVYQAADVYNEGAVTYEDALYILGYEIYMYPWSGEVLPECE